MPAQPSVDAPPSAPVSDDTHALAALLVDLHGDRVHDLVFFVLGDRDEAEELTAEVLGIVAQHVDELDDRGVRIDALAVRSAVARFGSAHRRGPATWPMTGRSDVDVGRGRISDLMSSWRAGERAVFALSVRHDRDRVTVARILGWRPVEVDAAVTRLVRGLESDLKVSIRAPATLRSALPMIHPVDDLTARVHHEIVKAEAEGQPARSVVASAESAEVLTDAPKEPRVDRWRRRLTTAAAIGLLLVGLVLLGFGIVALFTTSDGDPPEPTPITAPETSVTERPSAPASTN